MIVVDTNIITYFLLPGERTPSVNKLYERDPEWIAPRLWVDEFLNVLATYERLGRFDGEQSNAILADALALMEGRTFEIPPSRVLSVARRTACSAYDSQYIALAEDKGLKLLTCDKKVLQSCPDLAEEPA